MAEETESVSLRTVWVGVEEADMPFANQFLLQLDVDRRGVFLTAGVLSPPVVLGTPEDRLSQFSDMPFLPIRPVARMGMTRERFEELRALMNQVADTWPQPVEGDEEHDADDE